MRVAIVHSAYSGRTPSGENIVVEMQAASLRGAGHKVLVVSISSDETATKRGHLFTTAFNVATGFGADPTEALVKFRPDVVHVHNLFPNFSTRWLKEWPGAIVCTVHNFRSVCSAATLFRNGTACTLCPDSGQHHAVKHACYRGSRLATLPLAIRNLGGIDRDPLLARSDGVIFLSERSQEQFRDFGLDVTKTFVVPNFVADSKRPIDRERSKSWIYAGRMVAEKGIERLLSVWPTTVPLHLFGEGPDSDRIKAKCRGQVTYHGLASRDLVLERLSTAKGLVIPSIWAEGLPTTYLEALAVGVPVLAKSGNSAADDVEKSNVGRVFEDWLDVPSAVAQVEADWPGYSRRALMRYERAYSEAGWVNSIERVYTKSIAAHSCRSRTGNRE